MSGRVITLTTDFGQSSPYVAAMKGVILSIAPDVTLVDLTHAVPPQDIRYGALVLAEVTPRFPADALHIAVVDPGVGSKREIVYVELEHGCYIAPDNGLLGRLVVRARPRKIVALADPAYWLKPLSATFHGRDIMAPVAAHLCRGLDPNRLGPPRDTLEQLEWREAKRMANRIAGEVQSIDSFGNLITNITAEQLQGVPTGEALCVRCDEHETRGLFRTYSDQPEMTLIALIGSGGLLELAIVGDSAAAMLGVRVGEAVTLSW